MSKQLTMSDINKLNKKYEEQKRVLLLDGKYEILIQKHFKDTTIKRLLLEYTEIIEKLNKENVDIYTIQNMVVILNMLIIKYFTNLKISNDLGKMLDACDKLIDVGVFKEIMESFDKKEMDKIGKAFEEFSKKLPEVQNLIVGGLMQNASVQES